MEFNWEKPEDVMLALLALYEFQTQDEQNSSQTVYRNNVGFNSIDALFYLHLQSKYTEEVLLLKSK